MLIGERPTISVYWKKLIHGQFQRTRLPRTASLAMAF
jgi:hypothetical protein